MSGRSIAIVFCLALGACSRSSSDPALVENPAPLTDCSDDAFISILGGGQAVVCVGSFQDPQVRTCVEEPFTRRVPFAHVARYPGPTTLITVYAPEKSVYQVRRFARPDGELVELFSCWMTQEMPGDDLPFVCPSPGSRDAPVHRAGACEVLERARSLRRMAAERAVAK